MICQKGLPDRNMKCSPNAECSLPNCSICQRGFYSDEICFKCKNGFLNSLQGCRKKSEQIAEIEGCSLYSENFEICKRCRMGFFIRKNGKCVRNVYADRFSLFGKRKSVTESENFAGVTNFMAFFILAFLLF